MPLLRCTDDDCGHQEFIRSALAEGSDCEVCGAPTRMVGVDDDPPAEVVQEVKSDPAHPAHARKAARTLAKTHKQFRPPVVAHAIARDMGYDVQDSRSLGSLRGRLVGRTIEVSADEPPVAKRFTVAHELGHVVLGTSHGDDEHVEQEADAFAGELLVPGHMLREALEQTTDLRALCAVFRVSRQVLEIAASTHHLKGRLTGT